MKLLKRGFFQLSTLYAFLGIVIWGVMLVLELKQLNNRVWLDSILIVGYWSGYLLLIQTQKGFPLWLLRTLVQVSFFLFILHLFLQFLNIYSLGDVVVVQLICGHVAPVCVAIVKMFSLLRIYRFITFSSMFLFLLVSFFVGLFVFQEQSVEILRPSVHQKLQWCFFAGIVVILLSNLALVVDRVVYLTQESWANRRLSFEDRFVPLAYGVHHQGCI